MKLRFDYRINRKQMIFLCAFLVTAVLSMQLIAATVWTADAANAGPGVTIVQLSQDSDSDWATNDLINRLSEFITDDPFFKDRISVIKTNNPSIVESITDNIIIYVSHGGPLGIVTGRYITSWNRMAKIIDNSKSPLHLFTACYSRNIIRHGSDDSKQLYTVPGARPAEVTNVEIVTTVMLAFGIDEATVNEYRTNELTQAKEIVESGQSVHIMDFQEIILTEIENIDESYSDTYTSDFRVYREAITITYTSKYDFPLLHSDLTTLIYDYFRWYVDNQGIDMPRDVSAMRMDYIKNYYIESIWISDPPPDPEPPPVPEPDPWPEPDPYPIGPENIVYLEALYVTGGHWENSTPVFTGGTYAGQVIFPGDGVIYYPRVSLNVTASGPTLDASGKTQVDSISLNQIEPGGTYIQKQKIDGVWQEPTVGRNSARTGGAWTDPGAKADYEYDSTWPPLPATTMSSGSIHSTGDSIFVDSIPTGTGWHGPSFVRTLPSYFKMEDMGAISANLSISHEIAEGQVSLTSVNLYDDMKRIVLCLRVVDFWSSIYASGQKEVFEAQYYLEDGTMATLPTDEISGDASGIVQIRFEPAMGVYADVPGKDPIRLFKWTQINTDRLIKYVVIQSCRYGSYLLNDARVNSIQMTYAGSEYTVFHDNCNDVDEFHDDASFAYGTIADGLFEVPSGESYLTLSDVGFGTGIDWSFKKSHHLNGVSGAGNDYQIQITAHYGSGTDSGQDVYLNGHAKTDFSDVRFVSSDGYSLLDYWCESLIAGNKAVFWVKVSENLDYDQEIFIAYGKSTATSMSNGAATFLFFDDFNDGSLNTAAWHEWGTNTGGTQSESGGILNYASTASWGSYGTYAQWTTGVALGMRTKSTTEANYWWIGFDERTYDGSASGGVSQAAIAYNGAKYYMVNNEGSLTNNARSTLYTSYITAEIQWTSNVKFFESHVLKTTINQNPSASMGITILTRNTRTISWDWVYLRKCVGSEPSHGEWGAEVYLGGWHGPNYVHVLDRPFRLFQLTEFSVIAGLVQSTSSSMGKTGVALFDDNKQRILTVEWCDDDSWGPESWLTATFYTQSGTAYSRYLWYGDSDLLTGVRLWWDPSTGGQGAIYVRSDNNPNNLLVGACQNASRVVKYAVVMGQGYASNPLLDMRIHDINVVADPNKRLPVEPAPVEADGSNHGMIDLQSDESEAYFDDKLGEANNMISLYWTGWWPTLHFVIQKELMTDVALSIHLTVDILGSVGIETFNVEFLGVQDMTEPEADDAIGRFQPASEAIIRSSNPYAYFLGIGAIMYTSARIIALVCPPGAAQIELIIMGMLGLGTVLIITGLLLLALAVAENQADPFLATLTFLGLALTALLVLGSSMQIVDSWGGQSTGAAKYFRFFQERYQNGNQWEKIGLKGRTHWMLMFTQILILCTIILIALAFLAGVIYNVFF